MLNRVPQVDNGEVYKPKTRPLQFKRGKSTAFKRVNPVLMCGEPAYEWDTKKLKVGDGKHCYNHLPYIGDHSKPKDGKSAYQIWIEAGNKGTINDFLESLIGEPGKSTYEIWLSLGNEGTVVDFINSIQGEKGERGFSAYEIWIQEGNEGTVTDFLNSLVGKSAYEIWLELGHSGTKDDFIEYLKGDIIRISSFSTFRIMFCVIKGNIYIILLCLRHQVGFCLIQNILLELGVFGILINLFLRFRVYLIAAQEVLQFLYRDR